MELKHSHHVLSYCSCSLILNYHRQKLHHNFILKEQIKICKEFFFQLYRTNLISKSLLHLSTAPMNPMMELPDTTAPTQELETAKCECCSLVEECTPRYANQIRQTYGGRWVCGLCGDAIKEERNRSLTPISIEEAVTRHANFYRGIRMPPPEGGEVLVAALSQLLRRSLSGSPRVVRSSPNTPRTKMVTPFMAT